MNLIQVSVKNLLFYAPARGYTILLRTLDDDPRTLPVVVGQFEAQAIAMAMEKIKLPRPMTHDLLAQALSRLTDSLDHIIISDLKEGTFYAQIVYRQGETVQHMDARPSDAIAVAIRQKLDIFVTTKVFEEAALEMPEDSAANQQPVDNSLDRNLNRIAEQAKQRFELEQALEKAVRDEDYEKAAVLRDQLDTLDRDS